MSPDRRRHRGAHPEDRRLFDAARLPALRGATAELSWLLGKGYAMRAALKLVGDRHQLDERQRLAVSRAACSDEQKLARAAKRVPVESLAGEELIIDGFNLIVTVEAALGGGVLLACRDGCVRDLSSVHGSYRSVSETEAAIALIGDTLSELAPSRVRWLLDRPVSNSGRLARKVEEMAAAHGWPWEVALVFNPDAEIARAAAVALTADSNVIDSARRWVNFNTHLLRECIHDAWIVDLTEESDK